MQVIYSHNLHAGRYHTCTTTIMKFCKIEKSIISHYYKARQKGRAKSMLQRVDATASECLCVASCCSVVCRTYRCDIDNGPNPASTSVSEQKDTIRLDSWLEINLG